MKIDGKRKQLYELLGDLPDRCIKISTECISVKEQKNYVLENLILDLNGMEKVPAYFVKPKKFNRKLPVILYNHYHGGQYNVGKEEFINDEFSMHSPPYAEVLTSLGFAGLCFDAWNFGKRSGRTETELFKEFIWKGKVLWGLMVYDSIRALDYLESRSDVDVSRIGTLGLSMGSTMSWWLAALDKRVKVCIDICCLTEFDELIQTKHLDGHGIYYYVPNLLKFFSSSEINSLICPRHHLSLNGIHDKLTPQRGLDKINEYLKREYEKAGVPGRWKLIKENCGHKETAFMRNEIIKYLKKTL